MPAERGYLQCRLPESFLEIPPVAAVSFEQIFSVPGSPGARGIVGKIAGRQSSPDVQYRADHAPSGFHHVGTLEQGGVSDHAIVQQALVAGAGNGSEII